MRENNSNKSRRKLLKSIAAGSGAVIAGKNLPESWSRPVVDTVILPSHAETTETCDTVYYAGTDEDYAYVCVALCGDAVTVTAQMGGVDIQPEGAYKFVFTGQATNNMEGTLNLSQSGTDCQQYVGENFLSSRRFIVSITGAAGSITIEEGDGDFDWVIDLAEGTCNLPGISNCTGPVED